jgi:hypothetical protein
MAMRTPGPPLRVTISAKEVPALRKRIAAVMVATLVAAFAATAQEPKPAPEALKVKAGDMAPDFTLLAYDGSGVKPISLHDYRGKKKVLVAFFVFAFTGG